MAPRLWATGGWNGRLSLGTRRPRSRRCGIELRQILPSPAGGGRQATFSVGAPARDGEQGACKPLNRVRREPALDKTIADRPRKVAHGGLPELVRKPHAAAPGPKLVSFLRHQRRLNISNYECLK